MTRTQRNIDPTSRATLPLLPLLCAVLLLWPARAADEPKAGDLLVSALNRWADVVEPPAGRPAQTFSARLKLVRAEGLADKAAGATGEVAFQSPDRLRVAATVRGETYAAGRDGQQLWVHEPGKKFAVLGKAGVPRFKADPASLDDTTLPRSGCRSRGSSCAWPC